MTLERQKYLTPFIIAQNEGKEVQFKGISESTNSWKDSGGVSIIEQDSPVLEYRIKPEPREFYKIFRKSTNSTHRKNYKSEGDAKEALALHLSMLKVNPDDYEIIKVREVIE